MKNKITNFALVLTAFVTINLLMSFAKPVAAPDEPKQYIVIQENPHEKDKFVEEVNQKLAAGWHLQGGVAFNGGYYQAMAK